MRQKCLPIIVLSHFSSPLLLRHCQNSSRLRSSFEAMNLSKISTGNLDIDRDWYSWKDTFLVGMADYIPKKKTQGKESSTLDKRACINSDKEKGILA